MFRLSLLLLFIAVNFLYAQESITLQLSWKNQFQFAGYYMAKERGFYQEANLNVTIKEYDNGINVSSSVLSGKADFGVGRSSLICDRYEGKEIVMLGAILQHSPAMLLVKKRDDITKIEDLKDKNIMLSGDLTVMAPINAMLQSRKVMQDMFQIQNHSFNVQDLIDGKTDAMLSYVSNEPYFMQKQNIEYRVFSPRDYNFDFYSDILFTSKELLLKEPELVEAFREASLKGWKYALEHKEEAISLILQKYNTQNKTHESLAFEANEIEKLVDTQSVELGDIDSKKIEYITQIYSLMGFIEVKETVEDFVYKKPLNLKSISLTQEEEEWLKEHPIIKASSEPDYAPWDFNVKGDARGYSVDYMNLLASKLGIKVEYVTDNWNNLLIKLENKEIDIVHTMFKNNTRKKIRYSNPYKKVTNALYINSNNTKIKSIEDLDNQVISINRGDSSSIAIEKKYPNIKLQFTNNYLDSLKEVAFNQADGGVLEPGVANYLIKEYNIANVKILDEFSRKDLGVEYAFHLGAHKDSATLISILNKTMQSLKPSEIKRLNDKWLTIESRVDYSLVWKVLIVALSIILLFVFYSRKLKKLVNEKTIELQELVASLDQKVSEKTQDLRAAQEQFTSMVSNVPGAIYRAIDDSAWPIVYISDEIEKITGYSASDFMNNKIHTFSTIMHPDDVAPIGATIEEQFAKSKSFQVDYRVFTKSGEIVWVRSQGQSVKSENGVSFIDGVLIDITEQKNIQEAIKAEKEFTQTLLDSQEQLIITTDGERIISANKTFKDFYNIKSVEEFVQSYGNCVCSTFNPNAPEGYLQIMMGGEKWIDYIINRSSLGKTHKVIITKDSKEYTFSVTATILPTKEKLQSAVFTDITSLEEIRQEIEAIHKHTRESIEYAALIQGALIPEKEMLNKHFEDKFIIWNPKDTVGGDIYLFEELRSEDESLLMVIDCTGHGVPGAFVTMLVKAIERQITAKIKNSDEIVSPGKLLGIFNKNMKQLLRQESIESISNAGFDGAIFYYNKKERVVKFAGAQTALFYIEEGELKTIKGNRYSVGYKKCDVGYSYKEHIIEAKEGMQFYLSTDGYIDQNGGVKGFPFGKKQFTKIIQEHQSETMASQKDVLLERLASYQQEQDRNDDITVIGLRI